MTYEFSGEDYSKASDHQKEWGLRIIEELGLRGHESILDLGCGDGKITAALADCLPQGSVLGIDASEGMLEAARQHSRPNLSFRMQDINHLDYDAEFDVIFSNATLHWVKDHRRLLGNCRRALNPGGVLRFNFAGDGNCSTFYAVMKEAMAEDRFRPYFSQMEWPWYMPALDEYEVLVREFEFAGVRVWGENADRYFADAEAMTRWIDQPSLVPFLTYLPEDLRPAFRELVVRRMIERTSQPDGTCFETFRRINLFAGKNA